MQTDLLPYLKIKGVPLLVQWGDKGGLAGVTSVSGGVRVLIHVTVNDP